MRRFTLAALMWMALGGVAWAQFIGNPQILTQQDTGSCASSTMCATFTIPANVNSLAFGLSGVSSDTLTFQGTVDGTNWRSILVNDMSSGTQGTTASASGNYSVSNPGFTQVRVVLTARVSGTPTVTLSRGFGVARLQNGTSPTFTSISLGNGSAASPSLLFTDAGMYRKQANYLGFSGNSTAIGYLGYRTLNGSDNVVLGLGTGQAVTDTANDTYLSTISPANVLQTGSSNPIGMNLGNWTLTATNTTTRTRQVANVEMDAITINQTGGAVTFNDVVNTRFRLAIPSASVTLARSTGIDFVLPSAPAGTITANRMIHIPSLPNAGDQGIFFENAPTSGSIASASGIDISLNPSGSGRTLFENGNTITAYVDSTSIGMATAGNATARPKTFTTSTGSPNDIFAMNALGSTGGWQGTVDLNVGYNAGTLRNGLRVVANTDGTTTATTVGGTLNTVTSYSINGALAVSATAPTVAAGFGSTSPGTVTHNTGTFVVMVTVGTNAGGTTGSLTLPSAPTGWACELHDVTNTADLTRQTGYTQTTAAFSTTVAWTTGDVLVGHCGPF